MELLTGLINFSLYFSVGIIFLVLFKFAYTLLTPHNEYKLIKEEKNTAAALGLGGALIGFALALSGAASNSVSILDFMLWAFIALIAQSLAFAIIRFIFMPKIVQRIIDNEISAGIMLAATSISVGLLNAACMSY